MADLSSPRCSTPGSRDPGVVRRDHPDSSGARGRPRMDIEQDLTDSRFCTRLEVRTKRGAERDEPHRWSENHRRGKALRIHLRGTGPRRLLCGDIGFYIYIYNIYVYIYIIYIYIERERNTYIYLYKITICSNMYSIRNNMIHSGMDEYE